jgi:uncharacterized membrane protein YoaK (UPF0700 family)
MWSQSNRHRIPVVPRIRKLAAEEANKFLGTPLATWALLLMLALLTIFPTIMGIEVILIVASSFAMSSDVAHGVQIFVISVSLALGLQNGAFRRVGGISVHTTYLTGMALRVVVFSHVFPLRMDVG